MEDFSIALVWLGFFASIILGLYFYFSARNKERMALIEKNADVSEIFKVRDFQFPWLKLGMIIAGIGIGLCLSIFINLALATQNLSPGSQSIMSLGCMLFFGGLGAIGGY
jgi:hypothetical protein